MDAEDGRSSCSAKFVPDVPSGQAGSSGLSRQSFTRCTLSSATWGKGPPGKATKRWQRLCRTDCGLPSTDNSMHSAHEVLSQENVSKMQPFGLPFGNASDCFEQYTVSTATESLESNLIQKELGLKFFLQFAARSTRSSECGFLYWSLFKVFNRHRAI